MRYFAIIFTLVARTVWSDVSTIEYNVFLDNRVVLLFCETVTISEPAPRMELRRCCKCVHASHYGHCF